MQASRRITEAIYIYKSTSILFLILHRLMNQLPNKIRKRCKTKCIIIVG